MRKVGAINISTDTPLALLRGDGTSVSTIFTNRAFDSLMSSVGIDWAVECGQLFSPNGQTHIAAEAPWPIIERAAETHHAESFTFSKNDNRMRMTVEVVAHTSTYRVFSLTPANVTDRQWEPFDPRARSTSDSPAFDAALNEALALALDDEDSDASIRKFLKSMGTSLSADRTFILEGNGDGTSANTYEWCAPGVVSLQREFNDINSLSMETVSDVLSGQSAIIIDDVEMVRDVSPMLYAYMKRRKTRVAAVAGLKIAGKYIGLFGIENPSQEALNTGGSRLAIIAQFLSIMIRNRNVRAHLDYLTLRDELTGILNRRGLEHYIHTVPDGLLLVLVYADINNLKQVNDTQGHEAGDELIRAAGQTMLQVAGRGHVYRLGGDEFAMTFELDPEDDCKQPIREVRKAFEKRGISMALGFSTTRTPVASIDALLKEADRYMYQNKTVMHNSRDVAEQH
jgi:diguanylate cyclase (GGDEF)-like protein